MKLIEKRRGNADLDTKKFIFPKESWDSVLVPQEPDPAYYDSFEGTLFFSFSIISSFRIRSGHETMGYIVLPKIACDSTFC